MMASRSKGAVADHATQPHPLLSDMTQSNTSHLATKSGGRGCNRGATGGGCHLPELMTNHNIHKILCSPSACPYPPWPPLGPPPAHLGGDSCVRWRLQEFQELWENLMQALAGGHKPLIAHAALTYVYYWYNFMPLARGTAVTGYITLLAIFLAADMPITSFIPKVHNTNSLTAYCSSPGFTVSD